MKKSKYSNLFKKIDKKIKKANTIVFVPHVDPDPDAICACMTMLSYAKKYSINLYLGFQTPILSKYEFIADKKYILLPDDFEKISNDIDLVIALDVGAKSRGGVWTTNTPENKIINLDHHIDNDKFGKINIVDYSFSSTCELVYEFLLSVKADITLDIAKNIYTGIVYDTGSFRYSSTTPKTHIFVADILKRHSFDQNLIYELLFENKKLESLCLQTRVFSSLELYLEGKVAYTELDNEGYIKCNAKEDDAIELVRIAASVSGVDFSVFVHEKKDKIKVSLRSKSDFDVNKLAKKYGGGGHIKASGFSVDASVKEVKEKVLPELIESYKEFLKVF
jgi:phosphoesterase RecJ-like protein